MVGHDPKQWGHELIFKGSWKLQAVTAHQVLLVENRCMYAASCTNASHMQFKFKWVFFFKGPQQAHWKATQLPFFLQGSKKGGTRTNAGCTVASQGWAQTFWVSCLPHWSRETILRILSRHKNYAPVAWKLDDARTATPQWIGRLTQELACIALASQVHSRCSAGRKGNVDPRSRNQFH